MIHYDLQCEKGHLFDGWFQSSAAYDKQAGAGLVECTVCGSVEIEKQLETLTTAETARVAIENNSAIILVESVEQAIRPP